MFFLSARVCECACECCFLWVAFCWLEEQLSPFSLDAVTKVRMCNSLFTYFLAIFRILYY